MHDESHENHIYAKRHFLHYFIHECGHFLGLLQAFKSGKTQVCKVIINPQPAMRENEREKEGYNTTFPSNFAVLKMLML